MKFYSIWRRTHGTSEWLLTSHSLNARTDKEAQSKLKRKFEGAGFSNMSLVAIETGVDPKQKQETQYV